MTTKQKTKQLNIRVSPAQYRALQAIAKKSEFPTTPQTVAGVLLKKVIDDASKNA